MRAVFDVFALGVDLIRWPSAKQAGEHPACLALCCTLLSPYLLSHTNYTAFSTILLRKIQVYPSCALPQALNSWEQANTGESRVLSDAAEATWSLGKGPQHGVPDFFGSFLVHYQG